MKTPKTFQKIFIAILLVVCSLNVQIFANETEVNLPAKTTSSKSWKDLKLHKFDLSLESAMVWGYDFYGNRVPAGLMCGYFSYSYSFFKFLCSPYVRLRFGIGTDFGVVCIIPADITLGIRLSDIKHDMQYDIYVYNASAGPYYPTYGFLPVALFCKHGLDIRYKNFLFGAYLLTAPNIGFGLNLGYSFEL